MISNILKDVRQRVETINIFPASAGSAVGATSAGLIVAGRAGRKDRINYHGS